MKRWLQLIFVGLIAGAMLSPMSAHADTLDENYSVPAAEPVAPASLTPPTTETYFTDLDGTTDTTKPTLLPAVEPATSTTSRASAQLPGDCAQVRQLIAEKKVSANTLCWGVEEETPIATRNATIISNCRTMAPNGTSWVAFSRFYACYHAKSTVTFYRPATLSIEGRIPIDFYQAVQLDPQSLSVTTASEAKVGPRQGAHGSIASIKLTTDTCTGCSVVNSATTKSGSSLYTSSATMSVNSPGVNARRIAGTSLKLEITAAVNFPFFLWNKTVFRQSRGVLWDCDTEPIGNLKAPGCVFGGITGTVLFDGRTPENGGPMYTTAIHMSDAMNSGLPGKIGSGKYLTRTNSVTIRDANRNAACPRSLIRPPGGYECDEFPFASTLEGGAANTKEARTFWYCNLSDPQRTGPLGFSRCMTPPGEGSFQGGALNSGYMNQRIRNGDKFAVGWSQV